MQGEREGRHESSDWCGLRYGDGWLLERFQEVWGCGNTALSIKVGILRRAIYTVDG